MRSKQISLVLHEGTPYGIKSAILSNWNGKVILSSRLALKNLKIIEESNLPAVYFLLGDNNKVYVGETDTLSTRLTHHVLKKEFWTEMIAVTSPELSKTEVKFLEHVFSKRLNEDGKVELLNSTLPKAPTMRKEMQDVMEDFVDSASDVLISMGYDFIGVSHEVEKDALDGIEVYCSGPEANGVGVLSASGVMVRKGSLARINETNSFHESGKRTRQLLLNNGVLKKESEKSYLFTDDHLFNSATAAACAVLARPANGLTEWKNKDGKTIKELEQE